MDRAAADTSYVLLSLRCVKGETQPGNRGEKLVFILFGLYVAWLYKTTQIHISEEALNVLYVVGPGVLCVSVFVSSFNHGDTQTQRHREHHVNIDSPFCLT